MLTGMRKTARRTLDAKVKSNLSSLRRNNHRKSERTHLVEALSDLHNLLEEYAPAWYTEEHHRKAEFALHLSKE
jgi:hypothetical protein